MKTFLSKSIIFFVLILLSGLHLFAKETKTWHIIVDKALANDEAIQVAINDLNEAGKLVNI